jgi:3-dehydroquinate dehydratase / shikimate dehydrogenase
MTRLIAVVKGPSLAAAKEEIAQATLADIHEIRLDLLDSRALLHLNELPRAKPHLYTFRKKTHGGARDIPEQDRLTLFEKCLAQNPEYCDIEADTDLAFFERVHEKYPRMQIIGSFHDFEIMPASLEELLERMHRPQISHYKIAVMAHTVNDALRLMAFAKDKEQLTCIAMGPDGQISRILSPVIGSEFCYAAIEEGDSPLGQLSLKSLCDIYRFRQLSKETKIYALLGDPVEKSAGHLFHNKSFPADAVYVKIHMPIPDMPLFFSIMRKFPFGGFSVTMPLKEQLGPFLTRIDPASATIGSVNTIVVQDEHLIGYNTDGAGALNALERHRPVKGLKIAILGAGGSARAIAFEALKRQAKVTVLNRTLERAQALAKDFGCEAGPLEDFSKTRYDFLVNTVPVDLIFDPESLPSQAIVMDIVYWENETPLLKAAKSRGCVCINGLQMFQEQALLQQKIWFGDRK